MQTRICKTCKKEKNKETDFKRNHARCIDCLREKTREKYHNESEEEREKRKQYAKEYYLKNKERILKQHKDWTKQNREKVREYGRKAYEKHREKHKQTALNYYYRVVKPKREAEKLDQVEA